MTAFGFGAPTGVGLSGESRGQLRDLPRWSALSLPTMSIGQEVSVTALQMVAAFGAIANGGTLMQPRLVRSVFDAEGKEIREIDGRTYVLEYPIAGDVALISALTADRMGNLVYRKTARNFGPVMATAARTTIVEVKRVVETGHIDPEVVVTPGIFVDRIVDLSVRAEGRP